MTAEPIARGELTHVGSSGLTMTYAGKRGQVGVEVLRGIDLDVPRGEFVVVLGPSGAGKSTLLRALAGLQRPAGGTIRIGEVEVTSLSEASADEFRRRHIGIVFQFFNLMPMLDVEENVAMPLMLGGQRLEAAWPRVGQILERLGVAHLRTQSVRRLSGGEMQRVAIARALVGSPDLILADEPTGNLDAALGLEVLTLLRELCEERRLTTLVFTHDLRAVSYAHRVIKLRNGRIEEVVANPYPVSRS